MPPTLSDRYRGSLLGLACGDAVGTTAEFKPRGSFPAVTDMQGGGPFNLAPGQWTDDTSMALCLAESLLRKDGFDAADQMGRYLNWWQWGYLSATGECFDIGMTVRQALSDFQEHGQPFAGSSDPQTAGNGSLMRLAPVVLFHYPDLARVREFAGASSRTTHGAAEAVECCQLFAGLIAKALSGADKTQLQQLADPGFGEAKVIALAQGRYLDKTREQIRGNGYCVDSLEAALWCFQHSDSYAEAVLAAANLGDDADTTAAIVGQLAGAFYGVQGIPPHWLAKLHMGEEIQAMADDLLLAAQRHGQPRRLHGSCLCKAVQYRVACLDMPIGHCHCQTCRKAHAAAFASTAGVMREHFQWTQGQERLSTYESSPGKLRHFCSVCGSHLLAERPGQPHVILRVATLDDDPGLTPQVHIWTSHDVPWLAHDTLDSWPEWPPSRG
ncbi:ADP-ribosylglycohydrolase [Pseudomonas sp. Fl5BN2]|nr:ADP-ribosylglycohydrolase [Pseudomonas sp. Fl5BN2]